MTKSARRGFTLIELLVVVAIIGLLSSVVMTALGNARLKAQDSVVKRSIADIRAQASLYYDASANAYATTARNSNACATESGVTNTLFANDTKIMEFLDSIEANNSTSANLLVCRATTGSGGGWSVATQLRTGGWVCADYTGIVMETGTNPISANGDVTCY